MGNVTNPFPDGTIWPVITVDTNGNYQPVSGVGGSVNSINGITSGAVTIAGTGIISVNTAGQTITVSASGVGTGDVVGPAGATSTAIAVYAGGSGKIIGNSVYRISGNILSTPGNMLFNNGVGDIILGPDKSVQIVAGSGVVSITTSTDDVNISSAVDANINITQDTFINTGRQLFLSANSGVNIAAGKDATLIADELLTLQSALTEIYLFSPSGVTVDTKITSPQYATPIVSPAIISGSTTIDWNLGSSAELNFVSQPSGAVTINLRNGIHGSSYSIQVINNASGTNSITWGSGTKWGNGTVGDLTASGSAIDFFAMYYNGTDYLSSVTQNFF